MSTPRGGGVTGRGDGVLQKDKEESLGRMKRTGLGEGGNAAPQRGGCKRGGSWGHRTPSKVGGNGWIWGRVPPF